MHAKMLVPKFSLEHEGTWYIHWPKDQPKVLEATSQAELLLKLAQFMEDVGRVSNKFKHVEPIHENEIVKKKLSTICVKR